MSFTKKDLQVFEKQGIKLDDLEKQLAQFKNGITPIKLHKAATEDEGIFVFSPREEKKFIEIYDSRKNDYSIIKFTPASGAASRMFKSLFSAKNILEQNQKLEPNSKEEDAVNTFIKGLQNFAFREELFSYIDDVEKELQNENYLPFLDALLAKDKMNYGGKPKALIDFHTYNDSIRNAFEEQIFEALHYMTNENGSLHLHFSISPEFEEDIKKEIERITQMLKKEKDIDVHIEYSFQLPSTDTIAVDLNNEPFRKDDGSILFRPGGHGALLQNLNALDTELVFLKNIDNLVHESKIEDTVRSKKMLGGLLMDIVENVHGFLELLEDANFPDEDLEEMMTYAREKLAIHIPQYVDAYEKMEKIDYLYTLFNRPIRVCGMVKNEGEPGGGPFYVQDKTGTVSKQIVESSQIDTTDTQQADIQSNATHFNPVDLVLYLKDFNWDSFDLNDFINADAGFITQKSYAGRDLKALELPGLWNGAMSDWITVFVEIPLSTFNPVKELNDLLRENHLQKSE